jgi:hypothetical protein
MSFLWASYVFFKMPARNELFVGKLRFFQNADPSFAEGRRRRRRWKKKKRALMRQPTSLSLKKEWEARSLRRR